MVEVLRMDRLEMVAAYAICYIWKIKGMRWKISSVLQKDTGSRHQSYSFLLLGQCTLLLPWGFVFLPDSIFWGWGGGFWFFFPMQWGGGACCTILFAPRKISHCFMKAGWGTGAGACLPMSPLTSFVCLCPSSESVSLQYDIQRRAFLVE